jgi:hypothetical protein
VPLDRVVAGGRVGAPGLLGDLLVQQRRAQGRRVVALREHLRGQRPVARLKALQGRRLAGDLGPGGPGELQDAGVLVGHPGHEAHLVEQVGEALGAEDHRHDVGLAALVAGDEVRRQCGGGRVQPVLQVHQVIARRQQLGLDGLQLRHPRVEALLGGGQAGLGVGDAVGGAGDLTRVGGDLGP